MRANLLKDLELVLRCRFWEARVFAVESLVCKSFVTTKSLKYQRRQIPTMLGICWQVINCDIRSLSKLNDFKVILGALKSGLMPHLSYQTHCPVEAKALSKNVGIISKVTSNIILNMLLRL